MTTSKKSPFRFLLYLGSLLAVVAVIATVVGYTFLGSAVKQGVNTLAPQITGTTVTLEDAKLSPLTGSGTLTGLVIGNPDGWSDANLASLGQLHLDIDPTSLLGDTIVIRDLVIEEPVFVYETTLLNSNVKTLLANIERNVGTIDTGEEDADSGEAKKLAVQRFILRGATVTVKAAGTTLTVPMPEMELNDLGSPDNGLTSSQLAFAVSKEIVADIITAATQAIASGKLDLNSAADSIKNVGGALKGLFGGKKDESDGD